MATTKSIKKKKKIRKHVGDKSMLVKKHKKIPKGMKRINTGEAKKKTKKSKIPGRFLDVKDVLAKNESLPDIKELINVESFVYSVNVEENGEQKLNILSFSLQNNMNFYISENNALVIQLAPDANVEAFKYSSDDIQKIVLKRQGMNVSDGVIDISDDKTDDKTEEVVVRTKKKKKG